ncbi:hypothetical protein HAX54_047395 [Datura stramonium]|uniref:Uncharacterized protein n=1 Tax=Datura stramonium TaxID=4076 RepID=A0ABS8ST56_DATST|nr:hypothetical protein [Datura stramonium]
MAYVAVVSLIQTLKQLLQRQPHWINAETRKMVNCLLDNLEYFQNFLEGRKVDVLEIDRIRTAVNEAEDLIELKIYEIKQLEQRTVREALRETLAPLVVNIDAARRKVMASSFSTNEVCGYRENQKLGIHPLKFGHSSRQVTNLNLENVVVGLEEDFLEIMTRLTGPPYTREIIPILGMGGIGKTTLARKAYDDPIIINRFDVHVWLTISQEYEIRDLLLSVVSCISNESKEYTEDKLMDIIRKKLMNKRYLVVMDDIWSNEVWDLMSRIFPDDNNGSRIILTSRLKDVAMHADPDCPPLNIRLLDVDESWKLLAEKVFGGKHVCPPELEDIGKQIAQKCQGLPLALLVVAGHLSKIATTQERWKDVSKSVSKVVANESDKCLGVLGMSYKYLPNHLKPCFLYMGVFPEDSDVNIERLINLWVSEGFLRDERFKCLEEVGRDYWEDLVSRNLIMVRKRRSNNEPRTCGVHDLVRDLILREAEKEKFLLVARIHEATNHSAKKFGARRYSFHSSMHKADFWVSSSNDLTRTLHFFRGLVLPQWSSFKLLRVLAILEFTFQDFPLEITKLVHLRHLEFNCRADLHWLVSKLYNLQTLIFGCRGDKSPTIPAAIWEMKHLRHLEVSNTFSFQIPSIKVQAGFKQQNLEELYCLCLSSATSELFSAIPNLKRLKIRGNWRECEREKISRHLNNISCLNKLEILKLICYGINQPSIPSKYVLPTTLKRLTLKRTYLPWEDMANIMMLPNLEVLKIKKYGFYGRVWRLKDEEKFNQLKFLRISWTSLEHWEASSVNFPNLQRLVLKRCIYLEEIPKDIGEICTLESLELHDCSISAAKSAKEIQEDQESMGNEILSVHINNFQV